MKTSALSTNCTSFLVSLLIVCFAPSVKVQAVSPPPDGGYPGGNTAEGQNALFSLTTGGYNTAVGFLSLDANSTNSFNTAVGAGTLLANTADQNTAIGAGALLSNTTGVQNTAQGVFGLFYNTTGTANVAIGGYALFRNTFGGDNTAIGGGALENSTTGGFNTALGFNSGSNVVTASGVICIGNAGADVSGTTWIDNVFGVTTASGTTAPVIVSDGGQLGTVVSSERFKKDIATMQNTSEAILALRPVTFHYKTDTKGAPQFGLIAEEVAKVNPALVLPDKEGKPYTVRYDAVNVMLLNEFLKEHKAFVQEQHKVEKLEATVANLMATVKEQAAQIQKVSAQLETSKRASQMVNNP